MHTHHSFFIHLSVDRHLDCFLVLPIVNSAAMNTGVYYLFELCFPPSIFPGVELLDHLVVLQKYFLKNEEKIECGSAIKTCGMNRLFGWIELGWRAASPTISEE